MELLIDLVKQHKSLYDPNDRDYLRTKFKDELWDSIAQKVNYPNGQEVKQAWQKLRDCHRNALRRHSKKQWRYQNQMEFLIPYMRNTLKEQSMNDLPSDTENSTQDCIILDDSINVSKDLKVKTDLNTEEYNNYSSFLILLALSHFALGAYCTVIYYYGRNDNLESQIQNDFVSRVNNYKYQEKQMDDIQKSVKCCGVRTPEEEYKDFNKYSINGNDLPATCCDNMQICSFDSSDRYHKDCLSSVYEFTIYTNIIIGFVSLGIAAIEMVAALLGICLSCCIWRNQSVAVWR